MDYDLLWLRNMESMDSEIYPLVNIQKTMERSTMLLMGKSTISTGPCSIADVSSPEGNEYDGCTTYIYIYEVVIPYIY